MKDDLYKKIKSILTGRNPTVDKEEIIPPENEDDLVNNFMNQILDIAWVDDELKKSVAPSYYLSKKENSYWLFNVNLKSLSYIKGGVEVIPVEEGDKSSLCMIGFSMYSIPNDLLVYTGWN